MLTKIEIYTMPLHTLLGMLGTEVGDKCTLTVVNDAEQTNIDLDDACLIVTVESTGQDSSWPVLYAPSQ